MSTNVESPPPRARATRRPWPLERMLFAMAGTVTLVAALLAATVVALVAPPDRLRGREPVAFVVSGDCVASVVLRRAFGVERGASDERVDPATRPHRPARPLRRDPRARSSPSPGSSSPSASASSRRASRRRCPAPAGRRPARTPSRPAQLIQQRFAGNASSGLMIVLHSPSLTATDPAFTATADKVAARWRRPTRPSRASRPRRRGLDLAGRPHGDRDGRRRRHPDRDGARRRRAEGAADGARRRRPDGQPHGRVGHVVRLQRGEPLGDDEVGARSRGPSRWRSSSSRSARSSPPACR